MSSIEDFNRLECELIPAAMVNAYVSPLLNPLNTSELIIDSSWGEEKVDLTPAIKFAETVTHLSLSPADTPLYLEYLNEANERDCIYGEDLAQIVPLMKLKDVDDTNAPVAGDTIVYDGDTGKFVTYPLLPTLEDLDERVTANRTDIDALQTVIGGLQATVTQLATQMSQVLQRLNTIEATLAKPTGIPSNARLVWGNINEYGDSTSSGSKNSGFYTHNPSTDTTNDLRFA